MSTTNQTIDQLNRCGLIGCRIYFIISFTICVFFLVIINMWLYLKLSDHVNQNYPETPCQSKT